MSEFSTPEVLSPVISDVRDRGRSRALGVYHGAGGYERLAKMWSYGSGELAQLTKSSGLTGRGGAEFPTGLRRSFLPPSDDSPCYLVVNADESESDTCKGVPTLTGNLHALIEGVVICLLVAGGYHGSVYLRREVVHIYCRLTAAARQAYGASLIGKAMGPDGGYDIEIAVYVGANVYICDEKTALLDSPEGRRDQSCLKPPLPAAEGPYARPTVIDNVETISPAPGIVRSGVGQLHVTDTESVKSHGFLSLSDHMKNSGQYEAPFGTAVRMFLGLAGGIRPGHELKFRAVGGPSAPLFTPEQLDVLPDYNLVHKAGSVLVTCVVMVSDETASVVCVISRWTDFYQHESCGERTSCRGGTYWMWQVVHRLEAGRGRSGDIDLLYKIVSNIVGHSFCALGDAVATPVKSGIELFREELGVGYTTPAYEFFPYKKMTLFPEVSVQ